MNPGDEKRLSILQTKTASRALNGSPGRQRRPRRWEQELLMTKCATDTDTLVIDPEDLPTVSWQRMGKTEDLSPTPEHYRKFGVDANSRRCPFPGTDRQDHQMGYKTVC